MKLKHIKLVGFKSFADSETLVFPGAITGIVGPNGCGKSNVVDAIRWVMGETTRHIRGTTLDDVVFNGTATRKPMGLASVEMVFDNADGGVGGQYADYAEISIRRTVNRDRESKYYLNGSPCRRKDIKSLMQGTGLAGNSYAIIQQGMVSQLVDARPEEVRGYIEEAAGISGYKDRRRESEIRMKRTRENLERVKDIRDEVAKQLTKLKRQAREAERFTELKRAKKRLTLEIRMLEQNALKQEKDELESKYSVARVAQEKAQTTLSGVEARLEESRERSVESNARLDAAKEKLYEHNAILTNAERAMRARQESKQKLKDDLAEVAANIGVTENDINKWHSRAKELEEKSVTLSQRADELRTATEEIKRAITACATQSERVGDLLRTRHQETSALHETLKVEKAKIAMYDDELERVTATESELSRRQDIAAIEELERQTQAQKETLEKDRVAFTAAIRELDEEDQALVALAESIRRTADRLHEQQASERELQGRLESLNALQEEALSQKDAAVDTWLENNNLASDQRLGNQIEADPRWEAAIEIVLSSFFSSVSTEGLDQYAEACRQFDGGMLGLIEHGTTHAKTAGTLAEKVSGCDALNDILGRVKTAESLDEALSARARLRDGESLVTRDGFWMGRHWMRVYKPKRENEGVLLRRHRVKDIRRELEEQKKANRALAAELEGMRGSYAENEERREHLRLEAGEWRTRIATLEATLKHQEELARHKREESRQATMRLAEVGERLQEIRASRDASERARASAEEQIGVIDKRYGNLDKDKTDNTEEVKHLEEKLERTRAQLRDAEIEGEASRVGDENAREHVAQLRRQIEDLRRRHATLTREMTELDGEDDKPARELEQLLQAKVSLERARTETEAEVNQINTGIQSMEARRHDASVAVENARTAMSEHRVALQVATTRYESEQKTLDEAGTSEIEMDETATTESKQNELEAVLKKIDRLGAINLAAMDEFAELDERKKYLDTQQDDLINAMQSLTKAIKKMDEESERRFTETLEKINANLEETFPRLFNGGRAHLKVAGDDLLNDGVTVMVKPPGKRLATIGLLSGGEKAMAASAVLLSIFLLNPAPFCVLDEVDAPLDDHNVEQLCALLREISAQVQFIMVTHNKISMEFADTLIGITMREPGVTRPVAVDIDDVVSRVEETV